jgi:hypothetical protein
MAVWTAVELNREFRGDVGISITPVGSGRLEVLLDGEELFNKKTRGVSGITIDDILNIKMTIHERLEALTPSR